MEMFVDTALVGLKIIDAGRRNPYALRITSQCVKIRFSLRMGRFPTGWLLMFVVFSISGRLPAPPALRNAIVISAVRPARPFVTPGELHVIA